MMPRKPSEIREAAVSALGLQEVRADESPESLKQKIAKEETKGDNSFFPFIERQKRDGSTAVGVAGQDVQLPTLESEREESPLPYGRQRSKSKSNNFGKQTGMPAAGHHLSQNELLQNSFSIRSGREDLQD